MPRFRGAIGVGDVLVTREGPWYVSLAIRIGAALAGLPAHCNHVIIAHHQEDDGRWMGIEGRPGGVGWVDLSSRLTMPLTNANNAQPKTDEQRYLIATAAETLLRTPYDWSTIHAHVRAAMRIWNAATAAAEWKDGEVPGHVVCSAFADWAYEEIDMPNPGGTKQTRLTTPGHWDKFIIGKEWENSQ